MGTDDGAARRRQRRRASAPQGAPAPAVPGPPAAFESPPRRRPNQSGEGGRGDRGLRDLVGAGPSQLGVSGALRARDANRPSADDLAEAERDLLIVRRHWKPEG